MSDTTGPVLKGIRFPATLDLAQGSGLLTVTVDTEDASTIDGVLIAFDNKFATGDEYTEYVGIGARYNSGGDSFADATPYSAATALRLNGFTSAGTYSIREVYLSDTAGNYSSYTGAQLGALGFSSTFTVTGSKVDRTGPTLTGLSLPATVDLGKGDATVIATAHAVDNEGGNGVSSVRLKLDREYVSSGGTFQYVSIGRSFSGTDSFADTTPTVGNATWQISAATAPGTYQVLEAEVFDVSGNSTLYTGGQLAALGFSSSITVTGSAADSTAPRLTGFELPRYVDVSGGTRQATFTAYASDGGGTGIDSVFAYFDRSFATPTGATAGVLISNIGLQGDHFKDQTPEKGSRTEQVLATSQPGVYSLNSVTVKDLAGNDAVYDINALRDLGIQTRFVIGNGTALPAPTAAASLRADGDTITVTIGSQARLGATSSATLSLDYDPERLHYVGAVASGGATLTDSSWATAEYASVMLSGDGHAAGTQQMYTVTFRQLSPGSDISLRVENFEVGQKELAFAGGDTLLLRHGGAGNDTLAGGQANDWIDGGAGFDTVRYTSDVRVEAIEGGYRVSNASGFDERLANVELLALENRAIALGTEGTAADAYRLYRAAFDRPADAAGLGYWIAQMDKGASLGFVAEQFIASPEFRALYGAAQTDSQFLATLYQHVLHRVPDDAGLGYWLSVMAGGGGRAGVLVEFSDSTENHAQVIGAIEDGIGYVPYG